MKQGSAEAALLTAADPVSVIREHGDEIQLAEELVSLTAPGSYVADRYRALRHTIERLRKESALHVLAVTSPSPGDGKTVTTLNLAGALAQSPDLRVLVIDADLRRPSVTQYTGLADRLSPGLANVLSDPEYDLDRAIVRLSQFNLSILTAGCCETGFYELLNSPRLERLLREARRLFDFVVVDTCPLLPLPDTRLLSRWVDGFVLVVAAHRTPRRLVAEALDLLSRDKVIGVVFNGDDGPARHHYGYHSYYYNLAKEDQATWWQRQWSHRPKRRHF
jgi:protein-tyrosine kinase